MDSAKKRAVNQHVDYDTFRNMVSAGRVGDRQSCIGVVCCAAALLLSSADRRHNLRLPSTSCSRWQVLTAHLNPISAPSAPKHGALNIQQFGEAESSRLPSQNIMPPSDTMRPLAPPPNHTSHAGPMLPAWRLDPEGRQLAATDTTPAAACGPSSGQQQQPALHAAGAAAPATAADFERGWRRGCRSAGERWAYLRRIRPGQLPGIFKVEISGQLLGEIVTALWEGCGLQGGAAAAAAAEGGADDAPTAADFALQLLLALTGEFRVPCSPLFTPTPRDQ